MKSSDSIAALILCAGSGTRTGLGYNKILYYAGRKTVLETTLDAFEKSKVTSVILVINPNDENKIREIAANYKNVQFVYGGETRSESVRCGLKAAENCGIIVIHDGARPFVSPALIDKTIDSAAKYGSGIAAVPAIDTIKEVESGNIVKSLPREKLYLMQTPQTFSYKLICDAYQKISGSFTDDAAIFETAGNTPKIVLGEYENKKITTQNDLFDIPAENIKIGLGFDVHELTPKRKLILGGVEIAHDKGLEGHSDADVLVHAIMDALLSAASLPDIGVLFPDNDPATEGISSLLLLDRVKEKLDNGHYGIGNISAVIMAQKPKLASVIPAMRETLAKHLGTDIKRINISATTTENLGIVGEEKGIAASATCILNII